MAYSVKSAYDLLVLLELLEQPIIGNDIASGANVSGLTLIFTTPSATVTFTGTNPLSAGDIKSQINTAVATAAHLHDWAEAGVEARGAKFLHLTRGDSGLVLSSTGTANGVLGFDTNNDSTQANVPAGQIRSIALGRDGIHRAVISPDITIVDGSTLTVVTTPGAGPTFTPTVDANLGAVATKRVKNGSGNVLAIQCHNLNGSTRYMQLHNTTSALGGSEVPVYTVAVPAGTTVVIGTDFFTDNGMFFSTGITTGFSTTEATYTAGAAGDQVTFVTYV